MFNGMKEQTFAMVIRRALTEYVFSVFNGETWQYEYTPIGEYLDKYLEKIDKTALGNFRTITHPKPANGDAEARSLLIPKFSHNLAAFIITNKKREMQTIIDLYNIAVVYSDYDESTSERALYEAFKFLYQEIIQ